MASETRLIDANALMEELSSLTMTITGLRAGRGVLAQFMNEYRNSVLRIVDEAPAVDAVEVVRCKYCKHYENHELKVYENCVRNERYIPMLPNDFCSYGERRRT